MVCMQEIILDRTDERLLHALQIEPRASWSDLAPVVGADAVTLARRWSRLRDDGIAWVTGHASGLQGALIEVECAPSRAPEVAASLQLDPRAWIVDYLSGSRDLLVTAFVSNLAELTDYVLDGLGGLRGINSVRTLPINEVLIGGSRWRLRALDSSDVQRVPAPRPPRSRAARMVPADVRRAVLTELWRDGRAPVSEIAERHGISAQRISDAIATMRQNGELVLRTDIARTASAWPVYTWYFIESPNRTIEATRRAITSVPEVRMAVTSSSRYNLILAVQLHRIADVGRFEGALENALPGARIVDRSIVLRASKHMGRPLDADGRVIIDRPAEGVVDHAGR